MQVLSFLSNGKKFLALSFMKGFTGYNFSISKSSDTMKHRECFEGPDSVVQAGNFVVIL